jgi:hypothetical protein
MCSNMYSNMWYMCCTYLEFVYIISHAVPFIIILTIYCYNEINTGAYTGAYRAGDVGVRRSPTTPNS